MPLRAIHSHAVVRELNPSLDQKSRTLTAEARLARNDSRLRPGMFVQVQLDRARKDAQMRGGAERSHLHGRWSE